MNDPHASPAHTVPAQRSAWHRRAPRTPCKSPGCPYLTRGESCPLHRQAVPAPQTTRTDAGSTTHPTS
jgi:hypothetical protein